GWLPVEAQGTVTVSEVGLAAVTGALWPPMSTESLAGVALKLMPVSVADAPGTSGFGETPVTCGAAVTMEPGGVSVLTYSTKLKVVTVLGMLSCQVFALDTSAVLRIPSAPSSGWSIPPIWPPYWK